MLQQRSYFMPLTKFMHLLMSLVFTLGLCVAVPAYAKDDKKQGKEEKAKTFAEQIKDKQADEGLFDFYRDKKTGKLLMAVAVSQLGKEFVYYAVTRDGVLEAGHFRGAFRENAVLSIRRHFDRLEIVEENTFYYFDPQSALSRAASANISPAVLASAKIVAEDKVSGKILIEADDLFLKEALHQIAPTPDPDAKPKEAFKVGELDASLTKIVAVKSYPKNSNVIVDYVYTNAKPLVRGSLAVTNPRSISISMQHVFIAMPENDYLKRMDDPRVGFFTSRRTDLTSHSATPYKDLVERWNLVKTDPEAALSEPVTPIVWWIENTTPHEYRDSIRRGALAWNEAFESAGFKNAIVVKEQPDDASWDAEDIRYNVLRWTSSPNPRFGGYGPSFVNPRSGEILGADIMLENTFVTRRLRMDEQFDLGGQGRASIAARPQGLPRFCGMGHHIKSHLAIGRLTANTAMNDIEDKRIVDEGLRFLVLHEIGHTLGLNHNMRATQSVSYADIYDRDKTQGSISASVMDYHAININPDAPSSADYFDTRPGSYDHWAIAFAYSPELADEKLRRKHLSRSTEKQHVFGNDADDMRAPGQGNDPRVMIGDLSDDAIAYSEDRVRLVRNNLNMIMARYAKQEDQSWQELHDAYIILVAHQSSAMGVVSRYVGGVYQDRAFTDQQTPAEAPFVPVERAKQKRAMAILARDLFAPDAFAAPAEVLSHLQRQRRGYDHYGGIEDPQLHGLYLSAQARVLDHLLHPNTLRRMSDSRLYGNSYSSYEMISDLTDAVFKSDIKSDMNTQRQMLQVETLNRLIAISKGQPVDQKSYDHLAKIAATAAVKKLADWLEPGIMSFFAPGIDSESDAHRFYLRELIKKA